MQRALESCSRDSQTSCPSEAPDEVPVRDDNGALRFCTVGLEGDEHGLEDRADACALDEEDNCDDVEWRFEREDACQPYT